VVGHYVASIPTFPDNNGEYMVIWHGAYANVHPYRSFPTMAEAIRFVQEELVPMSESDA
jgi:hypothetical protein